MLAYFNVAIGWKELIKRTVKDTMRDDAMGLAAQLAFYFFLALFPALLCIVALASLFPLENFTDHAARMIEPFAPAAVVDIIRQQMLQIAAGNNGGLIGIGLLGAIWSSSAAVVAIVTAMNRAYDIEETRPWWKVRITAILLTVGLAFFIVVSFTLVVAGPQIADALTSGLGISAVFAWTWKVLQWPLVFMLVVTAISLIYHFAPDADQDWVWITPGSLVATLLWLAGSVGFRFYVVNFGSYEQTYGTIGGIILALMWFYLSGLAIVIGAELNAEIEHASPWSKEPGEKVPGQRKKIGAAAARLFKKLQPS